MRTHEAFSGTAREECMTFLITHLEAAHAVPKDLARVRGAELLDTLGFAMPLRIAPPRPPGASPALVRHARWVIRDDDLKLLDALLDGVKASASAGFFHSLDVKDPTKWASLAAILAALFKIIQQATTKGARLDARYFQVVAELHSSDGLKRDQLLARLRAHDSTWTSEELDSVLQRLSKYPTRDGSTRAFVSERPGEVWSAAGV